MEDKNFIKVSLEGFPLNQEESLLFVDANRSIENENLLRRDYEKLPLSETASSNGSEGKPENSRRKKVLPSDTLIDTAVRLKSFLFNDNTFKANSEEYLKTKLLGLWHGLKFGWASNVRTNFSKENAICLLGKAYHRTFTLDNHECSNIDGFKRDFQSVFWFTYRRKFSILDGTNLTSDCGWGCMIRSGQMLIATALRRHMLPKGWIYSPNNSVGDSQRHKMLISWFSDFQSPSCPFSIHNLVKLGNNFNKKAGNWYGPSCICHIFKDAFKEFTVSIPDLKNISVIIAQDGGVYLNDIIAECSTDCCICRTEVGCDALSKTSEELLRESSPSRFRSTAEQAGCSGDTNHNGVTQACSEEGAEADIRRSMNFEELCAGPKQNDCPVCENWKPCIILVPMRLGRSSVNSIYFPCIFSLLLHDLCIGIIGGRSAHSLFFIGFQDEYLIHIDPHLIQDTVPLDEKFDFSSYHCSVPRKISISKIDPSSAVGFFCPSKSDFIRFVKEVPQLVSVKEGKVTSSLFEVIKSRNPMEPFELEDFKSDIISLSSSQSFSMEDEELVC